jgi:transposase-like protein
MFRNREDLVPRKKKALKRVSREQRAKILSAAAKNGWTAMDVEKKYGISRWTFYGWRKHTAGGRGSKAGRGAASGVSAAVLRNELRAILPGILREEIAGAMSALFGVSRSRRGARARRK